MTDLGSSHGVAERCDKDVAAGIDHFRNRLQFAEASAMTDIERACEHWLKKTTGVDFLVTVRPRPANS